MERRIECEACGKRLEKGDECRVSIRTSNYVSYLVCEECAQKVCSMLESMPLNEEDD